MIKETLTPRSKGPPPSEVIKTYVKGLDEALGGGIPTGSVVILSGHTGTYRTSLAYYILLQNSLNEGRRGIYFTFQQGLASLNAHFSSMGLVLSSLTKDRVSIVDMSEKEESRSDWSKVFLSKKNVGDIIVMDPLNVLISRMLKSSSKDQRDLVFSFFENLRDMGLTVIAVIDRNAPGYLSGGYVETSPVTEESFLADGVFTLRFAERQGRIYRFIRCQKLRGADHITEELQLEFDEGHFRVMKVISPT